MRIGEICAREVVHADPGASIREAAELMRHRHVGALVVLRDPYGERVPIGILTDRDIVLAVVAPGASVDAIRVGDAMTRDVACCHENDDLYDAVETMRSRGVRRLPVLDAMGSVVGMVAADDLYGVLGRQLRDLGGALMHEQMRELQARA